MMFSGEKKIFGDVSGATDGMASIFANRKTDADSKGPFGNQNPAPSAENKSNPFNVFSNKGSGLFDKKDVSPVAEKKEG